MTEAEENAAVAEIQKQLEAEGLAAEQEFAPGGPSPGLHEIDVEAEERNMRACGIPILRDDAGPFICSSCGCKSAPPAFNCTAMVDDGKPAYPRCRECFEKARRGEPAQQQDPAVLPLSDLRERIAILTAAGVTRYRDAGVELQFDPEAQQKKDGRTEPKTERF